MTPRTAKGLVLLAAAAMSLRVAMVLALASQHNAPLTYEHGAIADNLLAGRGFSIHFLGVEGPTSQQAPLYPAMLAGLYWLLGTHSGAAILAMQLLQCVAGTLIVLCSAWLAWTLVPQHRLVGWIAGWGAAAYPPHVYMVTHIQVVVWSTLLLLVLTAVVLWPRWWGTWTQPSLAGVLSGLLLLFDPILVLALPILAFALVARNSFGLPARAAFHTLRSAGVMALVTLLVISPWLVRNWRVHGEAVFIKSTFGYAFWQGNNPLSRGTDKVPKPSAEVLRKAHDGTLAGMDRALWEARHETYYIDDLLLKPEGYRQFQGLSEPQRSRLLGQQAWEFIRDNPRSYAQLCWARLRFFLLFDETNPKAASAVYRTSTLAWLLLACGGLGICALRPMTMPRGFWTLLGMAAVVTAFHTLTITSARFRIPLEPLTFVWCAVAVEQLLQHAVAANAVKRVTRCFRSLPAAALR